MFIIERLVGVSVYLALLSVALLLIIKSKPEKRQLTLLLYTAGLFILAYLYTPAYEADLYRIIEYMYHYSEMEWDEFKHALLNSYAPGTLMYYRVVGYTNTPGLLAGIASLIVFLNIFSIIKDYSSQIKSSGREVAYAILLIMSTGIFMQTIAGVRNMIAFSILARCFYNESVHKTSIFKNIIWYIIAALIHPAAIAAVILRLLTALISKPKHVSIRHLLLSTAAITSTVILLLTLGADNYANNALLQLKTYLNEVTYSYLWDNILTAITLLFLLVNYIIYFKSYSDNNHKIILNLTILSVGLNLFSIIFFFEHTIFVRFTQLSLIVSVPLVLLNIKAINATHSINLKDLALRKFFASIPVALLIISASRGALSSLKFFVIS